MQLQAANLVYIFDVMILSVTANKNCNLKAIMPAGDTPREKIQKDS